jgi:hypothetical protein
MRTFAAGRIGSKAGVMAGDRFNERARRSGCRTLACSRRNVLDFAALETKRAGLSAAGARSWVSALSASVPAPAL